MLVDWVEAFQPLVKLKNWHWGEDGKVRMSNTALASETPWLQSGPLIDGFEELSLDCALMHIFHTHVFKSRGIHSHCYECYKVVMYPNNLEQVDKISKWQRGALTDLGWPCKVGADKRAYTSHLWGAYFYCRGIDEGRARQKIIKDWAVENLGDDVKVILKRACTEFEISLGPSDKWEKLDQQDEVEKESEDVIDYDVLRIGADVIDTHVYQIWNVWESQTRSPVTYHEDGD
jgi:hypothetical protein